MARSCTESNTSNANIVLIGMPGVGKSTVGVILAKVMGYEFIDADLVIQKAEGRLLKDIIAEEGIEGFLEAEDKALRSIEARRSIIATGGSAVYSEGAMHHLSEKGIIVYLKQELSELENRLRDIENRGVVLKEGQTLEGLYNERCALYEKYADIVVDEYGLDIEQTVKALIQKVLIQKLHIYAKL